jgi:hypothetical protein
MLIACSIKNCPDFHCVRASPVVHWKMASLIASSKIDLQATFQWTSGEGLSIGWFSDVTFGGDLTTSLRSLSTVNRTYKFCKFCPVLKKILKNLAGLLGCIWSKFWKFYLITTCFTLSEPISLVKMFILFRLECIFLVFRVWTQQVEMYNILSIGRASVFVMPCFTQVKALLLDTPGIKWGSCDEAHIQSGGAEIPERASKQILLLY